MNQAHPLDGLLNDMLYPAAMLVGAVRARDPQAVAAIIQDQNRAELCALLVAVACMVPDDQTIGQLVLWTHGPVVSDDTYQQIAAFDLRPGMKQCTSCGEWWRVEEFYPAPTPADPARRKPRCRFCIAEARTERIARDTHRPVVAACSETDIGEAVAA